MQRILLITPALLTVSLWACAASSDSPTWPGWRGDGSGHSGSEAAPLYWDSENGIAWKTHLAGKVIRRR